MTHFVENKYYRWYRSITSSPDCDGYTELHHIIPRCMGGGDGENLVRLSARKHFLAHWILTKCTDGKNKRKMLCSLAYMRATHKGRPHLSSWRIALARRAARDSRLGATMSDSAREKIGAFNRGKILTEEHKKKISLGNIGNPGPVGIKRSEETKAKLREVAALRSPEAYEKTASFHRGRKLSLEHRQKMSLAKIGKKHKPEHIEARMEKIRGSKRTDEVKAKMSLAQIGNKNNLGHKHSVETRKRMSDAAIKREASKAIRRLELLLLSPLQEIVAAKQLAG